MPPDPLPKPPAGLCDGCGQQRVIRSGRGSLFSMCERGLRGETGFPKYPRLPVARCSGFAPDSDRP